MRIPLPKQLTWLAATSSLFLLYSVNDVVAREASGSNRAWVTVLTGDCYNNTMMIGTQILSIKRHSRYPQITMVLPTVSEDSRALLRKYGSSQVLEVPSIHPPNPDNMDFWLYENAFSKLNAWNLTEFEQVAFLDADAYLTEPKADQVFDLCEEDFCVVEFRRPGELSPDQPEPWVNTGMMVIRPDSRRYNRLVHEILPKGLKAPVYVEEGYIGELLSDKSNPLGSFDIWRKWRYNSCSSEFMNFLSQCLSQTGTLTRHYPTEKFAGCLNPYGDQVSIVHHCGALRMTTDALCADHDEPNRACQFNMLRGFQDLMKNVNKCVLGSQSESSCMAAFGCQWCGEHVRCIPAAEECHVNSRDTELMVRRYEYQVKEWTNIFSNAGQTFPGNDTNYDPVVDGPIPTSSFFDRFQPLLRSLSLGQFNEPKRAWVTLLTGESYNKTMHIGTQILSVAKHSDVPHVTLVLPYVGSKTRAFLTKLGSIVKEVPAIHPLEPIAIPWHKNIFAKLNVWSLTEYDQVAYLDGDAFLLSSEGNKVFTLCKEEYCVVERLGESSLMENDVSFPKPWPSGGLYVVKPDSARFRYLVKRSQKQKLKFPNYLDEGMFAEILTDGTQGLANFRYLDWRYNSCSGPYFVRIKECLEQSGSSSFKRTNAAFAKCANRITKEVSIVHPCDFLSLSVEELCRWKDSRNNPNCRLDQYTTFQDLMVKVNPCVLGGQSEDSCGRMMNPSCQWCGVDVRCIPREHDCHKDSADTKSLSTRHELMQKGMNRVNQ